MGGNYKKKINYKKKMPNVIQSGKLKRRDKMAEFGTSKG
jgi:hypothetical protein